VEFCEMPKSRNGRHEYGETVFSPEKVIRIHNKLSDEHTVKTFFHEYWHTLKLYKQGHLREKQVLFLEHRFEELRKLFLTLEGFIDKIEGDDRQRTIGTRTQRSKVKKTVG
jgi:hypothetical protein